MHGTMTAMTVLATILIALAVGVIADVEDYIDARNVSDSTISIAAGRATIRATRARLQHQNQQIRQLQAQLLGSAPFESKQGIHGRGLTGPLGEYLNKLVEAQQMCPSALLVCPDSISVPASRPVRGDPRQCGGLVGEYMHSLTLMQERCPLSQLVCPKTLTNSPTNTPSAAPTNAPSANPTNSPSANTKCSDQDYAAFKESQANFFGGSEFSKSLRSLAPRRNLKITTVAGSFRPGNQDGKGRHALLSHLNGISVVHSGGSKAFLTSHQAEFQLREVILEGVEMGRVTTVKLSKESLGLGAATQVTQEDGGDRKLFAFAGPVGRNTYDSIVRVTVTGKHRGKVETIVENLKSHCRLDMIQCGKPQEYQLGKCDLALLNDKGVSKLLVNSGRGHGTYLSAITLSGNAAGPCHRILGGDAPAQKAWNKGSVIGHGLATYIDNGRPMALTLDSWGRRMWMMRTEITGSSSQSITSCFTRKSSKIVPIEQDHRNEGPCKFGSMPDYKWGQPPPKQVATQSDGDVAYVYNPGEMSIMQWGLKEHNEGVSKTLGVRVPNVRVLVVLNKDTLLYADTTSLKLLDLSLTIPCSKLFPLITRRSSIIEKVDRVEVMTKYQNGIVLQDLSVWSLTALSKRSPQKHYGRGNFYFTKSLLCTQRCQRGTEEGQCSEQKRHGLVRCCVTKDAINGDPEAKQHPCALKYANSELGRETSSQLKRAHGLQIF